MKDKLLVKGIIIGCVTLVLLALLYANYVDKLDDILSKTEIKCNEDNSECVKDLKYNIIASKESRNLIIYTGIATLFVLNAGAFSLYYSCFNKKKIDIDESNKEELKDLSNIKLKNKKKYKKR